MEFELWTNCLCALKNAATREMAEGRMDRYNCRVKSIEALDELIALAAQQEQKKLESQNGSI